LIISLRTKPEHAFEFTDLDAKHFRQVVHEVSAKWSIGHLVFWKNCPWARKGWEPLV